MAKRSAWRAVLSSYGARVVGAGFLAGLVASSCAYDEADEFNERAAELACEIYEKCDEDITSWLDLDEPLATACYTTVLDDFDECRDNCGFRPAKARRCIRRLERMADDCSVLSVGPCRRVYDECDADFNDGQCELWSCSVSERPQPAGALMALGLLVLGMGRRRRARAR